MIFETPPTIFRSIQLVIFHSQRDFPVQSNFTHPESASNSRLFPQITVICWVKRWISCAWHAIPLRWVNFQILNLCSCHFQLFSSRWLLSPVQRTLMHCYFIYIHRKCKANNHHVAHRAHKLRWYVSHSEKHRSML